MACGPPNSSALNPNSRPTLVVVLRTPVIVPTPRYHFSFQEFLDNFEAEYFNSHSSIVHLS